MDVSLTVAGGMSLRSEMGVVAGKEFGGRQRRLVTALLLLERHAPVSSEWIAGELWPHGLPSTWRSALRTLVAQVRRTLADLGVPPEVITHRPGGYDVTIPGLRVDIEDAQRDLETGLWHLAHRQPEAARSLLAEAAQVLGEPVLPGVDGEWLAQLRASLQDRRLDALVASARCERELGRWSASRQAANDALAQAPIREDAWRELMRVEAEAGNTGAALDAFRRCREELTAALGSDPDQRTHDLHARILRGETEDDPPTRFEAAWPSPAATPSGPPIVGRGAELAEVVAAIRGGSNLLVSGPGGIGKTRLVAEALAAEGVRERAMDRLMGSAGTSHLRLATLAPIGPGGGAGEQLSDVYRHLLHRWRTGESSRGRMLVWVDDAQHVDSLSAAILRHAVVAKVIQLVATHRSSEPLPDDVLALVTEGVLRPVELGPLVPEDATTLATQVAAAPVPRSELERIVDMAGGNPLLIRELAAAVDPHDRVLRLDGQDAIARPLSSLTPDERRTAELIALAEPVPASLLEPRAADVVALARRGLVRAHGGEDLRIDHPLRASWLVEHLGSSRGEAYRDLVALAQETDELDAATLVDWTLRAGLDPSPTLASEAARLAIGRSDGPAALRAVEHVRGPRRGLLHAQATVLSGNVDDGLAQLEAVRRTGNAPERVEAAGWLARFIGVMQGDYARAHALLSDTDDDALPPELRRHLLTGRLWLFIFGPISDDDVFQEVRRLAAAPPFDPSVHDVLTAALSLEVLRDSPWHHEGTRRWLSEIEATHTVDPNARARFGGVLCAYWMLAGQGARGASEAIARFAEVLDAGVPEGIQLLGGMGAWTASMNGRLEAAYRIGSDAISTYLEVDWFNLRRLARIVLLTTRVHLGEAPEVDQAIDELAPPDWGSHDLAPLLHTGARYLADEALGRDADVVSLAQHLRRIVEDGKPGWAVLLGAALVDRRTPPQVHRLVLEAAREMDGPGLARSVELASRARLDADDDALLRAGLEFERMGMVMPALRSFADVLAAVGADHPLGRVARSGVVRQWRLWDGPAPVCTRHLPGLPPHDLAVRVQLPPSRADRTASAGGDADALADALDLDVADLADALQPRA